MNETGNEKTGRGDRPMPSFFFGLLLLCASTLMYEVVLTRLLSAISWYYLAFVSVSTAMFGMTAGALVVQLRPCLFSASQVPRRLMQASFAMAVSLPLTLLTMLAVPLEVSRSAQVLYTFLLFSAIIAVPFFFSGIVVCLSLTKTPYPVGRVYAVDLLGAGAGCFGAVVLLKLIDAPSAMFAISALVFVGAAGYAAHAGEPKRRTRCLLWALGALVLTVLNASTLYGIQPIWARGGLDDRSQLLTEIWNPISKVAVHTPRLAMPLMWGASPRMRRIQIEKIGLDIDNGAATDIVRYEGDPAKLDYLRYDVTSVAAQLRKGGEAAIIGVGGGRDVLNAVANGFRRIVGIEVNPAILDLVSRRLAGFSGFGRISGLELHADEGRSFLTRADEKFDLIQASMVDTAAATAAGAMTLSENSLYTVEGWKIFYDHLKPGGLISFSRWYEGPEGSQTYRMVALGWAALLSEGAADPAAHLALLSSGPVATLILSNRPLSIEDLSALREIASEMDYKFILMPGEEPRVPELRRIVAARTLGDLAALKYGGPYDYSPVYDSSPFFFHSVHLRNIPMMMRSVWIGRGPLRALAFLACFLLAAVILVALTIVIPLWRLGGAPAADRSRLAGGVAYFIAIGTAFMFVEIAMMQQLSVFLGHPIYSLVVVLAGLIFSSGLGSLSSERFRFGSALTSRAPALLSGLAVLLYSAAVLWVIHHYVALVLWQRVSICLVLIAPPGLLMGFCFPVGLRWMNTLGQRENLAWMWALNGAAGVLASFVAIIISMETSISACVWMGSACYVLAALVLPVSRRPEESAISSRAARAA